MKMKWVCRYAYFGVLIALCGCWCGYCIYTIAQLKATVNSLEFLEMTINSFTNAQEMLERIKSFEGMLWMGLVVLGGILLLLAALIVFHVLSNKKAHSAPQEKKPAKEQAAVQEKVAASAVSAASVEAVKTTQFCPYCGAEYDELPAFCGACGTKIADGAE